MATFIASKQKKQTTGSANKSVVEQRQFAEAFDVKDEGEETEDESDGDRCTEGDSADDFAGCEETNARPVGPSFVSPSKPRSPAQSDAGTSVLMRSASALVLGAEVLSPATRGSLAASLELSSGHHGASTIGEDDVDEDEALSGLLAGVQH